MSRKVAVYETSPNITPDLREKLQGIFDTARDYPEIDPQPGWFQHVPNSDWVRGLEIGQILERHRREYIREYLAKPIVMLDDRTARDESVLFAALHLNDDEEFVPVTLRIVPERAVGAAMNISIANQDLWDYERDIDEDGVWRRFRTASV